MRERGLNGMRWIWIITAMAVLAAGQTVALTNADVIKMVKGGLEESVVVAAIQSRPGNFDTSPDALIALHQAGVTKAELDAMLAGTAGATQAAAAAPATPKLPSVAVTVGTATQPLAIEHTQLAQTKTKPTSMASLAGDSVLSQAIQSSANTAAMDAAAHINSNLGSSAVQQAGSIVGGFLSRRKPNVTYVWGVAGAASSNVLQAATPSFLVDFAGTPGVNPAEFEPAIVKLTPAQNTCRLVGATEGKADADQGTDADWQIYSSFLETRVAVSAQKLGPGRYRVTPQAGLLPGEYAVVLRPLAKDKKFSGGDVARDQGDGMMFDTIWTFQVQVASGGD